MFHAEKDIVYSIGLNTSTMRHKNTFFAGINFIIIEKEKDMEHNSIERDRKNIKKHSHE